METSTYCEVDPFGNVKIYLSRYTIERALTRCSPKQICNMNPYLVLEYALEYAMDATKSMDYERIKNKERLESIILQNKIKRIYIRTI